MATLQRDHTAHRAHDTCKELCLVLHELGFEEVGRAEPHVAAGLEEGGETGEERDVGVEFDLTCVGDDRRRDRRISFMRARS
jgi:hypothetical protein